MKFLRERWVDICATIIALMALYVSISQLAAQREHDRLSVRPQVSISYYFNDHGSGYRLANNGLGPGRVGSFEALVDDEGKENWNKVGRALGFPKGEPVSFTVPNKDLWVKEGTASDIFWLQPGQADNILRANNHRVLLWLCYCSIYDECWITNNRGNSAAQVDQCPQAQVPFGSVPPERTVEKSP